MYDFGVVLKSELQRLEWYVLAHWTVAILQLFRDVYLNDTYRRYQKRITPKAASIQHTIKYLPGFLRGWIWGHV